MRQTLRPPFAPNERRSIAIALAALLLFGFAGALANALAHAGPPTPGETVGHADGGSAIHLVPTLQWNTTTSLTFTNLSGLSPGDGVGVRGPSGGVHDNRSAYADQAHVGQTNVTYPGFSAPEAGIYALEAPGLGNKTFKIEPRQSLNVTVTPSEVRQTNGFLSITVDVRDRNTGAPVAEAVLQGAGIPPGARTDSTGRYAYAAQLATGTHTIQAGKSLVGAPAYEVVGERTFQVTESNDPRDPTAAPDATGWKTGGKLHISVTPSLKVNGSYDLTFRNLTGPISANTTFSVELPNGTRTLAMSDATPDADISGAYEVTFPGIWFTMAGDHRLTAPGVANHTFTVDPARLLNVTTNPSSGEQSDGFTSFTITVRHATTGEPVSNARLQFDIPYPPADARTDSSGRYYFSGSMPDARDYLIHATFDQDGDGSADLDGYGVYTVLPRERNTLVAIGDANAAPGFVNITPLVIEDVGDLGAITVEMRYDPNVVAVQNVTSRGPHRVAYHDDAANATLRMLVTVDFVPGMSGTFVLADIALRAVGASGTESALTLNVTEAAHSDGTTFTVSTRDGVFKSGLKGDLDGDGDVDGQDAQALADYVVRGHATGPFVRENGDINRDGRLSGIDVMMLRQYLAGHRHAP